ncbi:MAG: serine/threonine protein kinase [Acidobacteriales bacterium]|nr:serine/threonine protein kinase [Terriglobales bacterium]
MLDQTVSHYKITGKLGAGGMGEVYRASDSKLNREVALKVLPQEFARDTERMARFKREAQLLASLNHPNIATIYGLEETNGSFALIMELVEGETLAERISQGQIPLDEALPLAKQIVDALESAHEKGIIHRDLKPANVKITPDGVVKVLDFGLAKALEGQSSSSDLAKSPTISIAATQAGIILGTAAYMSPEQAKGKSADRRADIWAFGVVLFEMLTGKQAFIGETVSDTLAGVLRAEPEWNTLPSNVPPGILGLLHRCLIKDPKHRLQSIGDARIEIEEYLANPDPKAALPNSLAVAAPPSWLKWATVVVAVALLVSIGLLWRATRPAEKIVSRYSIAIPDKYLLNLITHSVITISPDGSKIVLALMSQSTSHLYLRKRNEFQIAEIPGTDGAQEASFSPDGEWVAFFANGKLLKVSVSGGPPITVAQLKTGRTANDGRGITWPSSESIVYSPDATEGLYEVSSSGGAPKQITTPKADKGERSHRWPEALPGGKAVLFTIGTIASPDNYDNSDIDAVLLSTGERRTVLKNASMVKYASSGHLVFARGGNLYGVGFDPGSLKVIGSPVPVFQGVSGDVTTGAVHFAVAADGTLICVPGDEQGLYKIMWVDRKGEVEPIQLPVGNYWDPKLSLDGKRLAMVVGNGMGSDSDIWIYDFVRKSFSRFTFGGGHSTPLWSPDGNTIYYSSRQGAHWGVWRKAADGSGEAELLIEMPGDFRVLLDAITTDGKNLYASVTTLNDGSDIVRIPVTKGAKLEPMVTNAVDDFAAEPSPDGAWLAYESLETGRPEIYVRGTGALSGKWQISTGGGEEPRWSHDGRQLFFRNNNQFLVAPIDAHSTFQSGTPTVISEANYNLRSDSGVSYSIAPDGRFLMIRLAAQQSSTHDLHVVLNFTEEIRRAAGR